LLDDTQLKELGFKMGERAKIINSKKNIKQKIIQKIDENDPIYKIINLELIDLEIIEGENEKIIYEKLSLVTPEKLSISKENTYFLNILLTKLQNNSYVGNIIWPAKNKVINNEIIQKIENKIKKNNWNYERFPNYFLHLLLSSHVYNVSQTDSKVIFKTDEYFSKFNNGLRYWMVKKIHKSDQNGYLSVIYVNEKTKQIVIAHKGISIEINSKSKLEEILGEYNGRKFERQILELIKEVIEMSKMGTNYNISLTGHSFGVFYLLYFLYY